MSSPFQGFQLRNIESPIKQGNLIIIQHNDQKSITQRLRKTNPAQPEKPINIFPLSSGGLTLLLEVQPVRTRPLPGIQERNVCEPQTSTVKPRYRRRSKASILIKYHMKAR
jgi:hypothetical protein